MPKNQNFWAMVFSETLPVKVRRSPTKVATVRMKGTATKMHRVIEGMVAVVFVVMILGGEEVGGRNWLGVDDMLPGEYRVNAVTNGAL